MVGNERFTLQPEINRALALQGITAFDLDVAACAESHWASIWYGIEIGVPAERLNGLKQPWFGNVWCNPPFTECGRWVKRAWQAANEPACHTVSMLLPGNRIEQPWWQELVKPFRDGRAPAGTPWVLRTDEIAGRVRFGYRGNPRGEGVGSPPFVCVYLFFSRPA